MRSTHPLSILALPCAVLQGCQMQEQNIRPEQIPAGACYRLNWDLDYEALRVA